MKSTDRIIKDIRYYEIKPKDFTGDFNGTIGNVYHITEDTNSIGQRIARKLNEWKFISGEFDHIYINFTENLKYGKLIESEKLLDKRIKYVDYGIEQKTFNSLTEFEKNQLVKDVTFKSLFLIFGKDEEKNRTIIEVEKLINKFETEIEIAYKTKETSLYRIEIGYMINPKKTLSKIVVKYFDKKSGTQNIATKDLYFYEDIFYLVDKIDVKNGKIIFTHKKTSLGEIATSKYEKPIEIEITEMVKITNTNSYYNGFGQ
jgi:hypothetical protein